MRKLIREPLVHFILLGAILFALNAFWQSSVTKADRTIIVSPENIERLATIFTGEQRRTPSDEDIKGLIAAYVEEEALSREAERLGLGNDDTIIRRRLAQKMQFMTEDVDMPALPSEAELEVWFEARRDRFAQLASRSFSHIYFSPETRRDTIEADAKGGLANIPDDWETMGDPFMMRRSYTNVTAVDVKRLFGGTFADNLFAIDTNEWTGPVESAFGLHLVRIESRTDSSNPVFEDVKARVANSWQEEARIEENLNRRKEIINRYKVVVED